MKAEIGADGSLKITAETELERYALKCWSYENMRLGAPYSKMIIACGDSNSLPTVPPYPPIPVSGPIVSFPAYPPGVRAPGKIVEKSDQWLDAQGRDQLARDNFDRYARGGIRMFHTGGVPHAAGGVVGEGKTAVVNCCNSALDVGTKASPSNG